MLPGRCAHRYSMEPEIRLFWCCSARSWLFFWWGQGSHSLPPGSAMQPVHIQTMFLWSGVLHSPQPAPPPPKTLPLFPPHSLSLLLMPPNSLD